MAPTAPRPTLQRVFAAVAAPGVLLTLFAFFLPWYSISCGGMSLATATGYDSATHGFHPPATAEPTLAFGSGPGRTLPRPPATSDAGADDASSRRDLWLLLLPVFSLVALGGVARALMQADPRTSVMLAGAAAFAAALMPLLHATVVRGRLRDALAQRAGADPMQRGVADALQRSVTFQLETGWYLALTGATVAAIAAALWLLAIRNSAATGQPTTQS